MSLRDAIHQLRESLDLEVIRSQKAPIMGQHECLNRQLLVAMEALWGFETRKQKFVDDAGYQAQKALTTILALQRNMNKNRRSAKEPGR